MISLIECTNVWFDYMPDTTPKDEWIIQNLNLSIKAGEYVAIIGPNGSGKSTLVRLLNGLLMPSDGSVQVDGLTTDQVENHWPIRQRVGVVFQNPDHQIVAPTVQDDIAFGLENLGLPIKEMKQRIADALEKVNLTQYRWKEPHHLSGGQKQRLAIAGVIAMQPQVVIFDEATSMLDPQGALDVLHMMKHLNQQKTTILHITHSMNQAFHADRIILLAKGQIRLDVSRDQVGRHLHLFKKWELDLPFHLELYRRLKNKGWPFQEGVSSQEDLVKEIWRLLSKN